MDINKISAKGSIDKKHLLTLSNYKEQEIYEILLRARDLSFKLAVGEKITDLKDKFVLLITKRSFARSRIAFEVAVSKLSGKSVVTTLHGSELEELLADKLSIASLESYGMQAVVVQTSEISDAETIEKSVNIPIINANSKCGPCETLSMLYTIWQKKGRLTGLKATLIGRPDEFADSVVYGFANSGLDLTFVCPEEFYPSDKITGFCKQFGDVAVTESLADGVKNADVIFVSDDELPDNYTLTDSELNLAKPDAVVLRILPLSENGNVSEEVVSSPNFCALDEAKNLPLIEMAALSLLVNK